jgi:cholesterol transport system auxiliary component
MNRLPLSALPRRPAAPRLLALAVCAVALSGCISLLPKTKPSQLYSFVPAPTAVQTASASPSAVAVFRTNGSFQSESADDRLLTITNGKDAYIADTRWVAPAAVLFDQAVSQAFDASPIRLIARGQQGRSAYGLRVDVRNFETRYDAGEKAAPTVVVRIHAALNKADQTVVGEQIFEAKVTAGDNRVGAIVVAYDKAMAEAIKKLIAWTETGAV